MRGYHIRIAVQLKLDSQTSQTSPFVPSSIFERLPSETPRSTARRNAVFNPKHKDYRFGPLRIDWVDFDTMSKSTMPTAGGGVGKVREQRGQAAAAFIPNTKTKSGSTNLPEGTVHIFRDSNNRPSMEELEKQGSSSSSAQEQNVSDEGEGVTLAVLAVPSWMTPSDFLAFVAPAAEGMTHLRLIRDSAPNRSIVVINFSKTEHATDFTEEYNGRPFNSLEPEICQVVRVLSVEFSTEDAVSLALAKVGSAQSSMYELPTCPVCLERMDSAITGLITVPCSHTFHCMCLSKWGDSRCPVCRYSQNLLSSHPTSSSTSRTARSVPFATPSSPSLSTCADCASTTNLWVCLICGNIGCGRYGRAHAHAHYESTTHLYALELETQRVWDYAGDGYVHRLIQNKADGKLVELPSASMSGASAREDGNSDGLGPSRADRLGAEKIEAIGIEYSYLLTSQLDSQRAFYEDQTSELQMQISELRAALEHLSKDVERSQAAAQEEAARRRQDEDERLASAERDRQKAETLAARMTALSRQLERELKDERAVNAGLMRNLAAMKERADAAGAEKAELKGKVAELEDQVRDVMFFLEAKEKIERGEGVEGEAAGGSLEVVAPPEQKQGTGKKKKSKK